MSEPRQARIDVSSFLRRNGWEPGPKGQIGEFWLFGGHESAQSVAVPYQFLWGSPEFDGIVSRVSNHLNRAPSEIVDELEREFSDVQQYRIADAYVINDSVELESAMTVLQSARRLLRVAATTARKVRPYIGANFSPPGDALAAKARLAHTKVGSFLLPVSMPVDPPTNTEDDLFIGMAPIEPAERRVTRTLATAVNAVHRLVVSPAVEPKLETMTQLIQSGVSKELVAAVRGIATQQGTHAFDVRFRWAPGLSAPGGVPERVVIPDEAAPLLLKVEEHLAQAMPEEVESVSGNIVQIRHVPREPLGEIAIRTIRKNRNVEVRIVATEAIIQKAFDWAKTSRAIIAMGTIVAAPGRPLSIPEPEVLRPLDELLSEGL